MTPPGRPRLLVRIERVGGFREDQAFGLLFYGGKAPVAPVWADLGRIFGLTPAEAAVVRGLVSGRGAEQLAADQGIGLETVRTHIRRAYHKLGVSSREQLYAAVSPLCIL
jgi:DNA-binding CsgD family transcriptional regulator